MEGGSGVEGEGTVVVRRVGGLAAGKAVVKEGEGRVEERGAVRGLGEGAEGGSRRAAGAVREVWVGVREVAGWAGWEARAVRGAGERVGAGAEEGTGALGEGWVEGEAREGREGTGAEGEGAVGVPCRTGRRRRAGRT